MDHLPEQLLLCAPCWLTRSNAEHLQQLCRLGRQRNRFGWRQAELLVRVEEHRCDGHRACKAQRLADAPNLGSERLRLGTCCRQRGTGRAGRVGSRPLGFSRFRCLSRP